MKQTPLTGFGLLRVALALLCSATFSRSAISFADIRLWAGPAAGPNVSEAAVVIDFRDGSPGLVWGYRWPAQESRTGQDMLAAILGADPALSVDSTFFPNSVSYGPRSRGFSDNGTPANYFDDSYWGYWVNNNVYFHPTDFLLNGHIVPPATEVLPLGNPYDTGAWVESSTGAAARPMVNGSWDGWAYGVFGTRPGEPVAAIPEPASAGLLAFGLHLLRRRRRGLRQPAAALGAAACCGGARSMDGAPDWPSLRTASQQAASATAAAGCAQSTVPAALTILMLFPLVCTATGPYPPGPSQPGSDAIPAASALFKDWAHSVLSFQPGPRFAGGNSSPADYGSAASVSGPPDSAGVIYPEANGPPVPGAPVLSLGDGGQVTLVFSPPIADGEDADFAVFENGFDLSSTMLFAELAFVEVSSNGTDFVRFPAVSCTQTTTQLANSHALDPRNLHNFAGKHPAGSGTPFDLSELIAANPELNVSRITHVRVVDVTGDVKTGHGSRDANGNWINDPFPTNFQTCGFDLDAVGVIHQAEDAWQDWLEGSFDPAMLHDPAMTGAGADPDGDSRTNLIEYTCGSTPLVADDMPPVSVSADLNTVVLQFHRVAGRTDAALTLQQSVDGMVWSTLAASSGDATTAADGAQITESGAPQVLVTVTAPRTDARKFYRLAVQRTP